MLTNGSLGSTSRTILDRQAVHMLLNIEKLFSLQTAKAAGWTFGVLCNCSILFGMTNKDVSLAASVIYAALGRTGWGLGMMWLTVACVTNNAGE